MITRQPDNFVLHPLRGKELILLPVVLLSFIPYEETVNRKSEEISNFLFPAQDHAMKTKIHSMGNGKSQDMFTSYPKTTTTMIT